MVHEDFEFPTFAEVRTTGVGRRKRLAALQGGNAVENRRIPIRYYLLTENGNVCGEKRRFIFPWSQIV